MSVQVRVSGSGATAAPVLLTNEKWIAEAKGISLELSAGKDSWKVKWGRLYLSDYRLVFVGLYDNDFPRALVLPHVCNETHHLNKSTFGADSLKGKSSLLPQFPGPGDKLLKPPLEWEFTFNDGRIEDIYDKYWLVVDTASKRKDPIEMFLPPRPAQPQPQSYPAPVAAHPPAYGAPAQTYPPAPSYPPQPQRTAYGAAPQPQQQHPYGQPAPAYGRGGPAPAYGRGGPAPAYGRGGPAPGYGQQAPAPGYHQQAPAPGYHQQAPAPGYHQQAPAPGYQPQPYAQPNPYSQPQAQPNPYGQPQPGAPAPNPYAQQQQKPPQRQVRRW